MDHTPQTPAGDDRPLRVLERTPVPEGQIFRLFGWVRVDPMAGKPDALEDAVSKAFRKAKAAKKR